MLDTYDDDKGDNVTIVCENCGLVNKIPVQYCAKCKAPLQMKIASDNLVRITLAEYRALREENIAATRLNYVVIGAIGTLQIGLVTIAAKLFGGDIFVSIAIFIISSIVGLLGLFLWAAEATRRMRTALYIRDVINPRLQLFLGSSAFKWEKETELMLTQLESCPLAWEEFLRNEIVAKHYEQSRGVNVANIFVLHYSFFFVGSVLIIALIGFGPLIYGLLGTGLTVFRLIAPEVTLTLAPQFFFVDPSVITFEANLFRFFLVFAIVWCILCFLKPGWVKNVWRVIQTERIL